jgi:hypothetical protein
MADLDRYVVRPKAGKLILYVLLAAAFVVVGVFLIAVGDFGAVLVGLLSIAFFGGGSVFAAVSVKRRGGLSQLTLTRTGIEFAAGGTVPWRDVESVGVTAEPTKLVGIRLRSYDGYLTSLTPEGRRDADRLIRFMKPFAHLLRQEEPSVGGFADEARDLASVLAWSRRQFGYDFGISPAFLDRSPELFVELLERYRQASAGS